MAGVMDDCCWRHFSQPQAQPAEGMPVKERFPGFPPGSRSVCAYPDPVDHVRRFYR